MAFDITKFFFAAPAGQSVARIHTYQSGDASTVINVGGYFNSIAEKFKKHDFIMVSASDVSVPLVVTSADYAAVVTTIAFSATPLANSVDGSHFNTYADGGLTPGAVVVFQKTVPGGTATTDYDMVVTEKVKVFGYKAQLNGAGTAGDTISIKNGADVISTVNTTGSDKDVVNEGGTPGGIDDAFATIASGGTLRITQTDGGGTDCPPILVTVMCTLVA